MTPQQSLLATKQIELGDTLSLVDKDDDVLFSEAEPWDFNNPPCDTIKLSEMLVKHMIDWNGIGLAAPQVGIPYRVFAMAGNPNFVCFNPVIVMPSEETIVLEEGCLTIPGFYVKVKRPRHVKVRFQSPNGESHTKTFTGITARCFQHELDHLDGIMFYNRANKIHMEAAEKRYRKYKKELNKGDI